MPVSPLPDLESLLAPVAAPPSEDEVTLQFSDFDKQFGLTHEEPDPGEKGKRWPAVIAQGKTFLRDTAKHFGVAARLTVALTEAYGFPGLGAGIELLAGLVERSWAEMMPTAPASRRRILQDLDNANGVWFFPGTVRLIPIVRGKEGSYGLQNLLDLLQDEAAHPDVRYAVGRAGPKALRQTADDVAVCRAMLDRLRSAFEAVMPGQAPVLYNIGQALDQARDCLDKLCPAPATNAYENTEGESAPLVVEPPRPRDTESWDSLLNQLEDLATALEKINRQSPVPYVVRHAVALGRLSFPALMRKLSRSEDFLAELYYRYDIPREAPSEGTSSP